MDALQRNPRIEPSLIVTCRCNILFSMKLEVRIKARRLRSHGESIKRIAQLVSVSSSTVHRWCADIVLSPSQRRALERRRREESIAALAPWIELQKKGKRLDQRKQRSAGTRDVGVVRTRDLFMVGLGLYWGEGYKRGSQEFGFTNCDPAVINTILRWLSVCYGVDRSRIIARLTVNDRYKHEYRNIQSKWAREVKLPTGQFSNPTFITSYGVAGRNPRTYRGTLRIKVRNSTSLRRRILAGIEAIS